LRTARRSLLPMAVPAQPAFGQWRGGPCDFAIRGTGLRLPPSSKADFGGQRCGSAGLRRYSSVDPPRPSHPASQHACGSAATAGGAAFSQSLPCPSARWRNLLARSRLFPLLREELVRKALYDSESLDMRRPVTALKIALGIVLCFSAAEDLQGQACQGCICSGSSDVHPATTLQECIHGCSTLQLVCTGRDILPTTTVIGLGFGGQPKSVPKDCTIRRVANGGMLTDKPASGCPKGHDGKH